MIRPLSLPQIRFDNDEWTVQQTFEKRGQARVVYAYGITRLKALQNFELEKIYLEEEREFDLLESVGNILMGTCETFELTIRAYKNLFLRK